MQDEETTPQDISSQSKSRSQSQSQSMSQPWYDSPGPLTSGMQSSSRRDVTMGSGEAHATSSVGSPGSQGTLQHVVTLDRGGGASGFIGKMSEISWIQRAFEIVRGAVTASPADAYVDELDEYVVTTADYSYFMDDTNVLAIDEDFVDQHHWPPPQSIVLLSEAFFHAIQGATCFILREEFLQDAFQFSLSDRRVSWKQMRWMAMANLVWAIGSKWLQMAKLHDSTLMEDHVVYYARARALGLDHRVVFDHPDIERIQGIGLLSFYLLINGSISR
jgi:hypothetical protein